MLDSIYVHKTRMRMGEKLAHKIQRTWHDHDIDLVIPICDTSRSAGLQMAYELELRYREGFIKTAISAAPSSCPVRRSANRLRQKLNAIDVEFRGKNVLLVDDSIVRGTTSEQIIQMAREAGAKKVYFASAAPPVRYPNVYGIDIPAASELVAAGRTQLEEIAAYISADRLIYQDLPDLIEAAHEGNPKITRFDASCFDGVYVTGDVNRDYLDRIERTRCDDAQTTRQGSSGGDVAYAEVLTFPR